MTAASRCFALAAAAASILLATAGATAVAGVQDRAVTVEAAGLRIVQPPYNDEQQMRAFNQHPGTHLAVLIQVPQGGLIDIDDGASELAAFTDDRGTDLLAGDRRFGRTGVGRRARISSDGRAALVTINGPNQPAPEATGIRAEGVLKLSRAEGTETATADRVALEPDTSFTLDGRQFTVSRVERIFGERMVRFRTDMPIDEIATMRFLDAEGNDITGSGRMHGGAVIGRSIDADADVSELTVQVELYRGMDTVSVPLELEVSIGS